MTSGVKRGEILSEGFTYIEMWRERFDQGFYCICMMLDILDDHSHFIIAVET